MLKTNKNTITNPDIASCHGNLRLRRLATAGNVGLFHVCWYIRMCVCMCVLCVYVVNVCECGCVRVGMCGGRGIHECTRVREKMS